MIVAYDMDGVLAESPPMRGTKWGTLNGSERKNWLEFLLVHYKNAGPLYRPKENNFHIITARKNSPDVVEITTSWLIREFGVERIAGIHFLDQARSLTNVISFKSATLKRINAKEFTEDNLSVLKGIDKNAYNSGLRLFYYQKGMDERHCLRK